MWKQSTDNIRTSMNEWTCFFLKIYLSHIFLERVDVSCVWEVNWRRWKTATYWPKVLLTIAALLSRPTWTAQPWVTEGPKPSVCRWLSRWYVVPNWVQHQLELIQAVCGKWLYNYLPPTCFRLFKHILTDSSAGGQYVAIIIIVIFQNSTCGICFTSVSIPSGTFYK